MAWYEWILFAQQLTGAAVWGVLLFEVLCFAGRFVGAVLAEGLLAAGRLVRRRAE